LVALVVLLVVLLGSGSGPSGTYGPALADPVPYDGRSPREPTGNEQRVLVSLPRPPLGAVKNVRSMSAEEQRDYVASLKREAVALRSALAARRVRLRDVVAFERTWNGFAATVQTKDLAAVASLGVRAQPVRRFYPATGEPVEAPGAGAASPRGGRGTPPIALLDSGVDPDHDLLRGALVEGYDAVGRDRDPRPGADPRNRRRREMSGTALAGVLADAGERVMPIRVAGLRAAAGGGAAEEVALSDALLAGLERAVDPDGDGSTDDRVPVAVIGVNAPYAGFQDSPEAQAIRGASALGTLVVTPAGNEGAASGGSGTIGSPGAAAEALTAGALGDPRGTARADVQIGDVKLRGAALLGGTRLPEVADGGTRPKGRDGGASGGGARPKAPDRSASGGIRLSDARDLRTSEPVDATDARDLARGGPPLDGRLAIVRAGDNPAAQAAAAAAAGARAVLLAEPRDGRPLASMPAGRVPVPVLGATGDGAQAALDGGAERPVSFGDPVIDRPGVGPGDDVPDAREAAPRLAPFTSRGPTLAGAPKPDLVAPGAAITAIARAGSGLVGGTGVAAARVAAEAARLARARPRDEPADLRSVLVAAAQPARGVTVAGGGAGVLARPTTRQTLRAEPPAVPSAQPAGGFTTKLPLALVNDGDEPMRVRLEAPADPGVKASASPASVEVDPGGGQEVELTVTAGGMPEGSFALGRLVARDQRNRAVLSVPWRVPAGEPGAVPLGDLRLSKEGARVTGVRFALGAFDRGDPLAGGTSIAAAESLQLELIDAQGRVKRRLTPAGGAPELLPAEYAYTMPPSTLRGLTSGEYAFRAVARGPRQPRDTERRSPRFRQP
jgi:hypothetical protein